MAAFDVTKEKCSRWVMTFATPFVCKEYNPLVQFFSIFKKIVPLWIHYHLFRLKVQRFCE